MELNTRSRVMTLNVVVLAGGLLLSVASYGAETEKPKKAERPDLPLKLEVAVPPAVREDVVARAARLCHRAFPKTPKKWFERHYEEYLDMPRWKVRHHAFGKGGPVVTLDGAADITLSFPAGRPAQGFFWDRRDPPPGHTPQEVELDGALRAARAALDRLVPRAADRRDLTLTRKKEIGGREFHFRWSAPVAPGHVDSRYVQLCIRKKTGAVVLCHLMLRERPPEPRTPFPRERIEKKLANLDPAFESKRLGLYVNYTLDGPRLCWRYKSRRLGLTSRRRSVVWDAATGERIASNRYRLPGHEDSDRSSWKSPEAYPWRTKKEVVERLEEMAAERAKELTGKEPEEPAEDE